ncbi:MAG TPA: LamG-like jellyroll fold domain-containing protein [Sedimentisphaerales bacterium]|nr:LamG-like jellyroll fold domain-containing protein [Sedimentisphaerales bacterium]
MTRKNAFASAALALGLLVAGAAAAVKPVVYYSFDTLGAAAADESGNGNDGTVNGGVTLAAGGHRGNCFVFNGSNAYIQLTRVVQDSFTLSGWVKTGVNGAAGTQAYQGHGLFWSDVGGTANDFVAAVLGTKFSFFAGNPDISVISRGDMVTGEWVHIAAVRNTVARTISVYLNGAPDNSVAHSNTAALNANNNFVIGANTLDNRYYNGQMDEVQIFDVALTDAEIRAVMAGSPSLASDPIPSDKATDVPFDTALAWTAGETAVTHDVYLGAALADVNDASRASPMGVLVSEGRTETSYQPDVALEFGKTYYWRIDEVNGAPDNTVFKGQPWSFTVESYGYPIAGITATASGYQGAMTPQNTVNGLGLDPQGLHDTEGTHMWTSNNVKPTWIQFQFDKVYRLHEMLVWNANQVIESMVGFGAKAVKIEYSVDGQNWTTLEGVSEFNRGPGMPGYAANTTVSFGGVAAQYVKVTIESNWGGLAQQVSMSEVKFFYAPMQAFNPEPTDGTEGVSVGAELNWRPGREATSHTVYLGTDRDAVAGGLVSGQTVMDHRYSPTLSLGTKYYWKVDESGAAEDYPGDVWSFTVEDSIAVDDFEGYTDDEGSRVYEAWVDGLTTGANGSTVGYLQAPFAEKTIVRGGTQSMPLAYDNTASPQYSEAERTFASAQDWTRNGVTTLVVNFRGQTSNSPASVYVKINGTKITYNNGAAATAMNLWKQWAIPLAGTGVNLKSVKTLTIGVSGGGKGTLFVDDIRLYAAAPVAAVPADPGTTGLVAYYKMDGDVQDASGRNYHGTISGTTSYETGVLGQALVFNGSNAYVDLPIAPLIPTLTDTTVSTFVYFGGGTGAWQRIFDFGSASGASPYMFLCPRENTAGGVRFAIRTAAIPEQVVRSDKTVSVGWHHMAVTIDSKTMTAQVYLDGDLLASGATTVLPKDMGATTQNWLGRSQYASDAYFLGSLDDFRLYSRVLSDGELRYLAGER